MSVSDLIKRGLFAEEPKYKQQYLSIKTRKLLNNNN